MLRAARSTCRGFFVKGDGQAFVREFLLLRRRGGLFVRAG
ncbi:MAG: hypothetical protein QOC89_4388 [Paraburkholderia sp.]|jgi:hypothetical protein|nr:hypothetical protein [Paraburkholderia sp.]